MPRRIFEERKFELSGKVISFDEFKLFLDTEKGFVIPEEQKERLVKSAEDILPKEIPQLYAHEYMMFRGDGNRSVFEGRYHPRRHMLLTLALGEYIEGKGRFREKIIDLLWLILEETTWVVPAHNRQRPGEVCPLPYAYSGDVDYIDLFSATTAATLAWVYRLCKNMLDEVTPILTERLVYELERRIIKPYLNDKYMYENFWWSGVNGNNVNNWCPWIVSNVLTVTALTVQDTETRSTVISRSMRLLDNFTSIYHEDGGCDEGPGYWNAAGGALFNACLVLYDMTGGYVNIFDDPLMKNMGEYAVKVIVSKERSLNFADAPSRARPDPLILYHWGKLCGSEMMIQYSKWRLGGELPAAKPDANHPYRSMRFLTTERLPKAELDLPKSFYIGGLEVVGIREYPELNRGLYVAIKGGNNNESHNHNDLGNVIVFADGNPIFIDAGSGKYTRKTFSSERYTIWAMRSEYHNCLTFNGISQQNGSDAYSLSAEYDKETGKTRIDLKNAYSDQAGLAAYTRSIEITNGAVIITDDVEFTDTGSVMHSYIVRETPTDVCDGGFTIAGRRVEFDGSLSYSIEDLDATAPEVAAIPGGWDTDCLDRKSVV